MACNVIHEMKSESVRRTPIWGSVASFPFFCAVLVPEYRKKSSFVYLNTRILNSKIGAIFNDESRFNTEADFLRVFIWEKRVNSTNVLDLDHFADRTIRGGIILNSQTTIQRLRGGLLWSHSGVWIKFYNLMDVNSRLQCTTCR